MDENTIDELVKNSYDMHFHVKPDILPRKYDIKDIIENESRKIAGIVTKSHAFSTVPFVNQFKTSKIDLIGSVTLNNFVGGLNPDVVYASTCIEKRPIVVWFPTIHAKNHLIKSKTEFEIPPDWIKSKEFRPRLKNIIRGIEILDNDDELIKEVEDILKMIQEMGYILATGHLSSIEAEKLTIRALEMDIKVILTHVIGRDIAMPLEVQKKLAKKGAYVEHCYIFWLDRDNPEDYPMDETAKMIKEVGTKKTIISSDAGQLKNEGSSESLKVYVKLLSKEGIKKKEFEQMLIKNPRKILGVK